MSPGQGVGPPTRYTGNTSLSGPAVGSFSRGPSESGQARTGKIPMKGEQQVRACVRAFRPRISSNRNMLARCMLSAAWP